MDNPKILKGVRLIQKCLMVGKDGKALALKRSASDHCRGLKWDFPGGGYEQGEDVMDSLKREVMEEVGLTLLSHQPIFIGNQIGAKDGLYKGDNVFAVCHLSTSWQGKVRISDEHIEYRWVTPTELLDYDYGLDGGFFTASLHAYLQLLPLFES